MADYRVATTPTSAAILAEGADAEVLVVRAPIPPEYFASATGLRAAVRHGAGLDMIPVQAATAAGVLVANVPGANATTVAEYAIFTALALRRQFRQMDAGLRGTGWNAGRSFADSNRELRGATLGIVGFGAIGMALAGLGRAFGMTVLVQGRRALTLPEGIAQVDLDELFARSDVVVLALPLTAETTGMIGAPQLALMRDGATLVNVARGPVVDRGALLAELASGRISAALDVFDTQPLPADDPLFTMPNVILTPHQAGITLESMLRMGNGAADEVARILAGQMPFNFCNPEVEPSYRVRFPA